MLSMRTLRRSLLSSCCVATTALLVAGPAVATTYTVTTGNTTTIATQITGANNVIVTGGGTLALTNTTNNYTGGSQILGGSILRIDSDAELGGPAGALTFGDGTTAGTLTFAGTTTVGGTRAVTLNAGSQTVNTGTFTDTIAANVVGTGALVKTGTGTLILTGANTYSGTTTISAGTLQIGNTVAASNIFDTTASIASSAIINNGTLVFNRGDASTANPTVTYAGLISGTGQLKQIGANTLILTANNTYTGVTTLSSQTITTVVNGTSTATIYGTLQLGNGGTTGWIGSSSVVNGSGATLAFDRSDNVSWGGVISSSGNVTQLGTGALTFTAANTYSGATTISSGSLVLTGAGAIASSAVTDNGVFDFSGITAASATIKSLAGSGSVVMGAKNLILTSGATFTGVISGTGALTLNSGAETLTGNNTYTGTTTIASGAILQLGSASTTGGVGSTLIVDNGNLILSRTDAVVYNGVVSGTGTLNLASTGMITLNGANTVTGLTTVSAGTLVVGDAAHSTASLGGAVTLVSGSTLSGYGTIAGAVTNAGTVSVGTGTVGKLTVGSYNQSGALTVEVSPAAASYLNVVGAASLGGKFSATFDSGTYSPAILPILKASSITGTFSASSGVSGDVAYGVVYPASGTEVDIVVTPRAAGQIYGDVLTANLDNAHTLNDIAFEHAVFDGCPAAISKDGSDCHGLTSWVQGFGDTNHMGAGEGASAFNAHHAGVIGGLGYHFNNEGSLNIALGYTEGTTGVAGGSAAADTIGYYGSVTGHMSGPIIALDGNAFYMSLTNDITRASGLGATITASEKNTGGGFTFQLSVPLFNGDVVPLARASYAFLSNGPFLENGGGALNLYGVHGEQTSGLFDVGVRLSHAYSTDDGAILRPHVLVALEDDGALSDRDVTVGLAQALNSTFQAPSPEPQRLSGLVRAGLDAKLDNAWSVQADVAGRYNSKQQQASFTLGASYHF